MNNIRFVHLLLLIFFHSTALEVEVLLIFSMFFPEYHGRRYIQIYSPSHLHAHDFTETGVQLPT